MAKFIERPISKITVCDYCRYHKCSWTKYEPGDLPSECPEDTSFEIADEYVEKADFQRRVNIAKRIGSFNPEEKTWYLNPTKDNPIVGYELKEIIEEKVNEWSEKNNLELSHLVDYREEGFERLG